MLDSFKFCSSFLHGCTGAFLQQIRSLNKIRGRKRRRKPNKPFSGSDSTNASSFAAMEVSNQLKEVFKLIDSNGDGKISSVELSRLLLCLGHERSAAVEEAEGMVREADSNGDGFIDLEEFMEVVLESEGAGGSRGHVAMGGGRDLIDAFLVFDSDKDGLISAKELRRVLMSLGFSNCAIEDCERMIRGVDKNNDGFVDFEEFRSMMTRCCAG